MADEAYRRLKETNALPSPTGVALEILRLAGDEKATLDTISRVVESDPALAGRMLKLVNSPFAGLSRKVCSVSAAVKLLGLRTVKNLALGLSLLANNRQGSCQVFDYELFWSESLARAVAARQIAAHLKNFSPDEAFAAGLLAKIGRLALATVQPEEYACVLTSHESRDPRRLAEMELQAFGIDHNALSAEMMADWRLQELFCEAVRLQDAPREAQDATQVEQLARLLHLAGSAASVLVRSEPGLELLSMLERSVNEMGMNGEAFASLFETIVAEWRQAGTIFSVSTQEMPPLEELRAQARTASDEADPSAASTEGDVTEEPAPPESLRILVADDDPALLRLVEKHLSGAGYQVTLADNGAEALKAYRADAAQMIITDWMMPEMDGLELCRRLRANDDAGFVYIIVLTAQSDREKVVAALDAGADDYLTKPFSREELLAHVRAGERIVRLETRLAERGREIARANAGLAAANDRLRIVATTDELTGLANRREGLARLAEYWALAERHGDPLACIVADIDYFKRFNDTYGHATGDTILKATAATLRNASRTGELVCRIGGEEFLVICPKSTAELAARGAERLRREVESNAVRSNGDQWSVTISLGVAQRIESMARPDDLLKAADEMLYAAKKEGRNRVCGGPVAPSTETRDPQTSASSRRRACEPSGDSGAAPVRVLIVDDDRQARLLCRRLLEREGYIVSEAADGREALDKVPACSPDVIVMDAVMPNLDGLECVRRLKADPATREIPVIMVSAAGEARDVEAGLESGADEYVTKPFRHREFTLRVRSMANFYRSKAELLWSNETRWEQARNLQALLDLSIGLVRAEGLDGILDGILSAAADLTRCRRISIMLPEPDGASLRIARCIGVDENLMSELIVPVGTAVSGQVFLSGRSLVTDKTDAFDSLRSCRDAGLFSTGPLASKPLRAKNQTVGVLNLAERYESQPFRAGELESLDLLCNVAATAISEAMSRQSRDRAQDCIVVALATLAEYRDVDTARHLDRVTRYARTLAEELRTEESFRDVIDESFFESLRRAMPLHDIGKVGVPDYILLKPGSLTDDEMEQMKRHAEIGARAIRSVVDRMPDVAFLRVAEEIAWCHHERWDGRGYPRGLRGEAIPLAARIAAVVDVYDALTTNRVYRDAMSHEEAVAIIREGAGSQFDPVVVQALLANEDHFAHLAIELADDPMESQSAAVLAGT